MTPPKPTPVGVVFNLLPVSQAARHVGISTRLLCDAIHRGQMPGVQLLQLGARQFIRADALCDFINSTKSRPTAT